MQKQVSLYDDFPRQVGSPYRKWVYTADELMNYINENNGKKDCFISVYKFTRKIDETKADTTSAIIDKTFSDFDNPRGYECFCILRDFIINNDLLSRIQFSGKHDGDMPIGFHFYIFTPEGIIKNGTMLRHVQEYIDDLIRKELKDYAGEIIDPHVMGDVARFARIANTYNIRRGCFCVPLSLDDLFLPSKEILKLSFQQRPAGDYWIGNKLWTPPENRVENFSKASIDTFESNRKHFPACINTIIERCNAGINLYHNERVLLCSFLLKIGMTPDDMPSVFQHQPDFDASITLYQSTTISEGNYMPSSCERLITNQLCKKNEKRYYHPMCFKLNPIKNPLDFYKQNSRNDE
jgi:hypothetical protein